MDRPEKRSKTVEFEKPEGLMPANLPSSFPGARTDPMYETRNLHYNWYSQTLRAATEYHQIGVDQQANSMLEELGQEIDPTFDYEYSPYHLKVMRLTRVLANFYHDYSDYLRGGQAVGLAAEPPREPDLPKFQE